MKKNDRVKTTENEKKNEPQAKKRGSAEDVRDFAYSLYEKRGRSRGHELQDWFDAEKTVYDL